MERDADALSKGKLEEVMIRCPELLMSPTGPVLECWLSIPGLDWQLGRKGLKEVARRVKVTLYRDYALDLEDICHVKLLGYRGKRDMGSMK